MDADTSRGNNADTNREPVAPSGWVTTGVAAKSLGVSPRTVRWHIEQGNLDAKAQGGGVRRSWLVSIDSLQAFRDTRQAAAPPPTDYRAPDESADTAAAVSGNPIRELADRLVEEASKASEFRVRLELSERTESTLREELAEERRRREEAERRAGDLERRLQETREAAQPPAGGSGGSEPRSGAVGAQEASKRAQRPGLWRRLFGG